MKCSHDMCHVQCTLPSINALNVLHTKSCCPLKTFLIFVKTILQSGRDATFYNVVIVRSDEANMLNMTIIACLMRLAKFLQVF